MDYIVHEVLAVLRQTKNEQNLRNQRGHAHQNWFVYASHIPLYLHDFFLVISD